MNPVIIVREALQALQAWDLERHLSYVSDDIIVELVNEPNVLITGKTAYRKHMEQFNQFPGGVGLVGFRLDPLEGLAAAVPTWLHAEVQIRMDITLLSGEVNHHVQMADFFFEVSDDTIRTIRIAGRNTSKVWRYDSSNQ